MFERLTRVKYKGSYRKGVWTGQVGTVVEVTVKDFQGNPAVVCVQWDPIQIETTRISSAEPMDLRIDQLEVLEDHSLGIPNCPRPTKPGMYLCLRANSPEAVPEVTVITRDITLGLCYCGVTSRIALKDIEDEALWWGPIHVCPELQKAPQEPERANQGTPLHVCPELQKTSQEPKRIKDPPKNSGMFKSK